MSPSLRDRLLALAAAARINVFAGDAAIQTKDEIAIAAARLALEDAARECERTPLLMSYEQHRPQSYYCAARIRKLAEGLDTSANAPGPTAAPASSRPTDHAPHDK